MTSEEVPAFLTRMYGPAKCRFEGDTATVTFRDGTYTAPLEDVVHTINNLAEIVKANPNAPEFQGGSRLVGALHYEVQACFYQCHARALHEAREQQA